MSRRTEMLLYRVEIRQVLAAYARGVDRVDEALIKSAFWPEAMDHHGTCTLRGHDYADDLVERLPRLWSATFHLLGQTYFIEMTKRRALAETAFTARHASVDPAIDGFALCGRYIDDFERRGGEWKILTRYVAFDFMAPEPSNQSFLPGMAVGKRAPEDRSYRLFPDPPPPAPR